MKIIREFKSRKNSVYLKENGDRVIVKIYRDINIGKKAYAIYQDIKLAVQCPRIYKFIDDTITMQYIMGETLLDKFLLEKKDDTDILVDCFLECINSLNDAGFVQTDNNFSNYIIADGMCYAIDFDEIERVSADYSYYDSIADVVLFALTYDGIDDEYKKEFVNTLIKKVNASISDHIEKAKKRYYIRRNRAFEQEDALQAILGYRQ